MAKTTKKPGERRKQEIPPEHARIGWVISKMREAAEVTQLEVARHFGKKTSSPQSKIETGARVPTTVELLRTLELLGFELRHFERGLEARRRGDEARWLARLEEVRRGEGRDRDLIDEALAAPELGHLSAEQREICAQLLQGCLALLRAKAEDWKR